MQPFFKIIYKDKHSRARVGLIHTDHGDIETPVFMPVGTQATVKTLDQSDLNALGTQIILGNTYHLHLRPGENLIAKFGGLHQFMKWNKPILTDSGGFQVFSLGLQKTNKMSVIPAKAGNQTLDSRLHGNDNVSRVTIDEDGVTFRSHIDGSKHRFTPESAIQIQHKIGADIIMAFDECTPDSAGLKYTKEAMERTHRWAERCVKEHSRLCCGAKSRILDSAKTESGKNTYRQFLFGIIQGANHKNLRQESAKFISQLDFDGIAIGGESIGYNIKATEKILDWIYPIIPENKPHYTMGVGLSPVDLLKVIAGGIDMFDCVAPTRLARHGMLFVRDPKNKFRINITNATYAKDSKPIDKNCSCSTCLNYSRAYLRHLFIANEMTGMRLATIHNIHFLLNLMAETRQAIKNNNFSEFRKNWYK